MARFKRRKYGGRKLRFKRRKSFRAKRVRKLKRRGGVYTKRTKFPAKNPFGDRALVKLRFNFAGFLQGDNVSSQTSTSVSLNNLAAIWSMSQSYSKGFLTYPKLFRRYKINGVMAKFTVYLLQNNAVTLAPVMAWMLPSSVLDGTPTVLAQNANMLKAERHTAWRNVRNWGYGGGPTVVKKFFKLKTLVGASYPTTDIDYSGTTDVIGNPYNAPTINWNLFYGISTVAQGAWASGNSVHYNLELTYYTEFFEQTWDQQNL